MHLPPPPWTPLVSARIPSELHAACTTDYEPAAFRNRILALASTLLNSETIELAGRLLLYEIVSSCGDLECYIRNLGHRFSKRMMAFLYRNFHRISDLLAECDPLNYYDHDLFSAFVLVKYYLLIPHYNVRPFETPLLMYLRVAIQAYAPATEDEEESVETATLRMDRVEIAFREMALHLYTHASPTIFNAGTLKPQCSSCFLTTLSNSLDSILGNGVLNMAEISKAKGGIGVNFGMVGHGLIANGIGMSSGVLDFAHIMNRMIGTVNQGSMRPGAATIFLPAWHIDIMEFINSTNNFSQSQMSRLTNLNTCVVVPDLLMHRAMRGEQWTTFCPSGVDLYGKHGSEFETAYLAAETLAVIRDQEHQAARKAYDAAVIASYTRGGGGDGEHQGDAMTAALQSLRTAEVNRILHKVYPAQMIIETWCDLQRKSGFPYILYSDAVNAKSMQANIGPVNSSNLCMEIVEATTPDNIASCNLASINLKVFVVSRHPGIPEDERESIEEHALREETDIVVQRLAQYYNFEALGECMNSVVRNLDAILETNYYPVSHMTQSLNQRTRPLGIGVSGFADAIAMLDLCFQSKTVEVLNKAIFAAMYYYGIRTSIELATEYGPYADFRTGTTTIETVVGSPPTIVSTTYPGSPAANGFFQFDLWRHRADVLKARGILNTEFYRPIDDIPVNPTAWVLRTSVATPSWEELRIQMQTIGLRNSMLLALMPTATSAQALRNIESTEQLSGHLSARTVLSGRHVVINPHMVKDLEAIRCWNSHTVDYLIAFEGSLQHFRKFITDHSDWYPPSARYEDDPRLQYLTQKYLTMYELPQKRCVLQYARQRGIYVCQSQSMNVFLRDPSPETLIAVHYSGFQLGLKTGLYYLRQLPKVTAADFTESTEMIEYKRRLHQATPAAGGSSSEGLRRPPSSSEEREDCLSCGS